MKLATAKRPVEQFDTELKLPEFQIEPDDEAKFGQSPEDYYYVDEQGNLIDPNRQKAPPPDDAPVGRPEDNGLPPEADGAAPPAAANDDFLDRATGQQVVKPVRPVQ